MAARHLVVIGASAGGLDAVSNVVRSLPSNLPATVLIVIHTSPEGPALLPDILGRLGTLPAATARDQDPITHGRIYVAPPDFHLLVSRGRLCLTRGPREHRFRPAVDPLFRSAAEHYGPRVIGVVLSGSMADGTHGLMVIKERGGVAVVQDPDDALFPAMPQSAIERVHVDHVLPSRQIGALITELTMMSAVAQRSRRGSKRRSRETSAEHPGTDALESGAFHKPPSPFTCPDCGGTLWELKQGGLVRYRCHVGHGFSEESLAAGQNGKFEDTLWSALRALEELIELRRRIAQRGRAGKLTSMIAGINRDIRDLEQQADTLRAALLSRHSSPGARKRDTHKRSSAR
jgi:two-component system chemotaxis response regulator CheB